MKASYVGGADARSLDDPEGVAWRRASAETVALMGTPLGLQPTDAIRVAWTGKTIGVVGKVRVAALHDGERLAFRLEWGDASESREIGDTTAFPDAAAVALRSAESAPLVTMGAPGQAVNAWYWRADEDGKGRNVVSEGLGTTRTVDLDLVTARGLWKEARWSVVISRALRVATDAPVAQLEPGLTTGFGVAVWEGGHGERAGIKAFSGDWRELRLEPVPTARR